MAMESSEALVAHIQALSGSSEEISQLQSLLKQAEESFPTQAGQLFSILGQLEPSKHSLGYLYILEPYSASIAGEQVDEFITLVVRFIEECSAVQIRLAPEKFVSVCKRFRERLVELKTPIRGIVPLRTAVRKLQVSSEKLTPLHSDFLVLCLLAKRYKAGMSVLNDDIYEVDQPRDFFLYCYYGGMISIGQKDFRKASEFLHNVITAPMSNLNAIAIEAFKKYVLVSLIQSGQVPPFPKYTSSAAQRNLKNHAQLYLDLANCYSNEKISDLEAFIESNSEMFLTDKNMGLVKQVLSSLYKRNIQRLTQVYLTLSLQDISSTVQLPAPREAEMHVLRMIQDGEIFATINQKDGMVSFHEDPEQYKSCKMIERIDSSIQRIVSLSRKLTSIDEQLSCDPAYVTKVGRERPRLDFDDFDPVPTKFL
ncbi:proteasome component (PCI) domain protein [Wolffia australiana]